MEVVTGCILITCKVPGTAPELNHLNSPAGLRVLEGVTKALEAM